MTVNYKLDMMHDVRKHLWGELVDKGVFDPEDYYSDNLGQEIIPILPVQQQPELNQFLSGKKHIVYDKIGLSYEENWLICCEQILFTVYSTQIDEINEIRNLMVDVFRRVDETARDINYGGFASGSFKFYSAYIADISNTSPSEELQGFLSTDIILEVKYSRYTDPQGRFI
jgi:hypothetical protein